MNTVNNEMSHEEYDNLVKEHMRMKDLKLRAKENRRMAEKLRQQAKDQEREIERIEKHIRQIHLEHPNPPKYIETRILNENPWLLTAEQNKTLSQGKSSMIPIPPPNNTRTFYQKYGGRKSGGKKNKSQKKKK